MSSEDREAIGYGHNSDLLIISLYLIEHFILNDKWVQRDKYLNNTRLP